MDVFRVQSRSSSRIGRNSIMLGATALASGWLCGAAAAQQTVVNLPTVQVQTSGEQTAWGPADGYVATNSAAGTKTDTPLIETSRAISVVTRQEMDDRGAQSVVDAVSYTAGVVTGTYGYDPRFDPIYLRGFSVTSRGDFRDGLSQVTGNWSYYRTEPYGLERIDVIKGPASVLYGQTVPGGLINRISKMPTDKAFGEVEIQGGSPQWYQAAFDIGGPATKDGSVLYRITGVARDSDAPINYTKNNELYLAPSLTFQNDATRLTILANILDATLPASQYYWQPGGVLTKVPIGTTYNSLTQTQEQVGYRLEHDFNDMWTARQNVRYGHIDTVGRWLTPTGVTNGTLIEVYPANYQETLDTFQADNQLQAKFATGAVSHKLLFGVDYLWADSNYGWAYGSGSDTAPVNLLNPGAPNSSLVPQITSRTGVTLNQVGLYAQDQMTFGDGWHFNIGGRQDFVTQDQNNLSSGGQSVSRDDNAFTWQTGLLYEFANGISPYVSYATSFLPTTNVDASGNMLQPSKGEQYEAGIKFQPKGGRSFFTLSAYQITQTNYAVPDPVSFIYSPVGDIQVRGFEAEAMWEVMRGFDLTAAYTYSDGVIQSSLDTATIGNTPVNMPANTASIWAKYSFLDGPWKGFGVGAGVRYVGEFYADNANTYMNPSQTMVDAALFYEKANWKFQINAKNLFNEQVALENEGYWYWSQGRTVVASAKYRW